MLIITIITIIPITTIITTIIISQVLTQLKFLESESEADHVMRWQPLGGNRINMTLEGPVGGTAEATVNGIHVVGGPGVMAMNPLSWISPDEADVIRNRKKEPVAAPEVQYYSLTITITIIITFIITIIIITITIIIIVLRCRTLSTRTSRAGWSSSPVLPALASPQWLG